MRYQYFGWYYRFLIAIYPAIGDWLVLSEACPTSIDHTHHMCSQLQLGFAGYSQIHLIGIWLIGISGSTCVKKIITKFLKVLLSHLKWKFYNCLLPEIPINWVLIKWIWLYTVGILCVYNKKYGCCKSVVIGVPYWVLLQEESAHAANSPGAGLVIFWNARTLVLLVAELMWMSSTRILDMSTPYRFANSRGYTSHLYNTCTCTCTYIYVYGALTCPPWWCLWWVTFLCSGTATTAVTISDKSTSCSPDIVSSCATMHFSSVAVWFYTERAGGGYFPPTQLTFRPRPLQILIISIIVLSTGIMLLMLS